jgi:hypothetical protein
MVVRRKSGNSTKYGTTRSPVRNGSRTNRRSDSIFLATALRWITQTSPPWGMVIFVMGRSAAIRR